MRALPTLLLTVRRGISGQISSLGAVLNVLRWFVLGPQDALQEAAADDDICVTAVDT